MSLLEKYDIPAPRYTSYPTVPYWETDQMEERDWMREVVRVFEKDRRLSLYIHLPFCEKLCTYCGCNKHITRNHAVESPYIQSVLAEWTMYLEHFPEKPVLTELHLGGGTPTFFHPENLKHLVEGILGTVEIAEDHEFSFEAHPASTTREHLETLYNLGFRRISIGVQDVDEHILRVINRFQTIEEVNFVTETARALGYHSVNMDLIFGLPFQKQEHIIHTMSHIRQWMPDRIAFYSYAHVPWLKNGQRAFDENDLPDTVSKRALYETGKRMLEELGYHDVGMDHFSLSTDALYQSAETGQLHRNFMGYTPLFTPLSIGLGASAIGDTFTAFAQNIKTVSEYEAAVAAGSLPLQRGHLLTQEDQWNRQHILNLMCRYRTAWLADDPRDLILARLTEPVADGLVVVGPEGVQVTEQGKGFLRNICLAFDARYWSKVPSGKVFSQAV
ncbi:MAG: oxygen-independent coproporphyrinogen III oxidase [Chitinophagales bacterium]|nr:oxygen-independent coproporphyrinogen III oxidase [Chitinophagales bacterium]